MIADRKSDGGMELSHPFDEDVHGLVVASEDLTRAIHSKDINAVASALRAAFEILDSEPHDEGPHEPEGESA